MGRPATSSGRGHKSRHGQLLDLGETGQTIWGKRKTCDLWLKTKDPGAPKKLHGCGSKPRYQNGTLVSGNMDQNLRNPSSFILSHTHMSFKGISAWRKGPSRRAASSRMRETNRSHVPRRRAPADAASFWLLTCRLCQGGLSASIVADQHD